MTTNSQRQRAENEQDTNVKVTTKDKARTENGQGVNK